MKLEEFVWSKRLQTGARGSPLGPYLDGFIAWAEAQAFRPVTIRHMVLGSVRFARFLVGKGITDAKCLTQEHVDKFISGLPRYCQGRYVRPAPNIAGAARKMLRYLRSLGVSSAPAPQPPVFAPLSADTVTTLATSCKISDPWLPVREYRALIRRESEATSLLCRSNGPGASVRSDSRQSGTFSGLRTITATCPGI